MKQQFNKLEDLNRSLSKLISTPSQSHFFNRNHIFYDILNSIKKQITPEKKLNLIFLFSEIEKALALLKEKKDYVSQVKKVENLYKESDIEVQYNLRLSYHPMIALYYFQEKDIDAAIENLESFFNFSNKILKDNNLLNLANGEQYLNLARVLIFSENLYKNEVVLNLLNFVFNEETSNSKFHLFATENKFSKWTGEMDLIELRFWKIYIANSVLKNYFYKNEDDLHEISAVLSCYIPQNEISYAFKSLNLFFREDYVESVECFMHYCNQVDVTIPSLLFLNLKFLEKSLTKLSLNDLNIKTKIKNLQQRIAYENRDLKINYEIHSTT